MARLSDYSGAPAPIRTPKPLTAEQIAARDYAARLAASVGATVDPETGMITGKPTTPENIYTFLGATGPVTPPTVVTPTGKKIVGYIKWTHPVSGATYNVPRYDDGTDGTSEWGGGAQVPASFMLVTPETGTGGGGGPVSTQDKPQMTYTASDGRTFTDAQSYAAYQATLDAKRAARQSAYDFLFDEFNQYGLGALVTPLKGLIEQALPPSEFAIRLRETEAYKKRFAANAQRVKSGLRALNEAAYIGLEDQYQNVMRQYGLPESYYAKGEMGVQPGFEKFIAGDVSAAELEDRIQTAQNRVINAAPEVTQALKSFYPNITNGDILAYALDPQQAITDIKRKVGAAEIGAGAMQAGLQTGLARAEELQRYGVTGEAARQQYQTIAGYLPRATQLSDIYAKQGMGPYTQTTAEAEAFGLPSAAESAIKRRKLTELEQAQFSGAAGRAGGALGRERAGQF